VRLLLQTLTPGPFAPLQSALVVHGLPDVPSKLGPDALASACAVASWPTPPSDGPLLASADGHPSQRP
jgi:hypothetical protein